MVCVRAGDAMLSNNGKHATSLCRQHQVVFGVAILAFIRALSRVELRRETNRAAGIDMAAYDSAAW
jgi:hypothetical protein